LQSFAQRLGHGVAEPWLQRLVVERKDFNGFFTPGTGVGVDGAEVISGATSQQRRRRSGQKKIQRAHFNRPEFVGAV
jgi:hypothetical protein